MNFKRLETAQKLRGGYYTEPDIASFLTAWVLEKQPQAVLEPSCGNGAFIEAIAHLEHGSVTNIFACEIDPEEAKLAREKARLLRKVNTSVWVGDFSNGLCGESTRNRNSTLLLATLRSSVTNTLNLNFSIDPKKSLSDFDFPSQSTQTPGCHLSSLPWRSSPCGRLAMVVPSEILHVIHAKPLRDFFLRNAQRS